MKEINFKIIELDNYQVLVEKDYDDEENLDLLVIKFFIQGMKVCQKLGFDSEEKRDDAFERITKEQVEATVLSTEKMFKEE